MPGRLAFSLIQARASDMAESADKQTDDGAKGKKEDQDEDDDYMGDLSLFLPPEASLPPDSMLKKPSGNKLPVIPPSKKQFRNLNWQERRKLDRERKQEEEDEKMLAKIEAPIPQSNIGFKLLKQMGYTPGSALGKEGVGRSEPVGIDIRRSRAGIGLDDPPKEKRKRVESIALKQRMKEEDLMVDFGSRQSLHWRSRRIRVNFKKAKAALDQLENKEVLEPEKEEEDGEQDDEEEEEEITEEDLQDILTKLRDEYQYCLFCGCQYESMAALLENCPGTNEEDH